jgi:hypothetical protein
LRIVFGVYCFKGTFSQIQLYGEVLFLDKRINQSHIEPQRREAVVECSNAHWVRGTSYRKRDTTMKKTAALAMAIGFGLAVTPAAHAWISFLDFNDQLFPPDPPWVEFFNEGGAGFVDLGAGNFALRLDSPDHTAEDPPAGTYYNEYYAFNIPPDPAALEFYEPVEAARFRLHSFTPTGQENILAPSTPVAAPSITLVDGHFWLWSFLSDPAQRPILDLGPAVVDEWHEVYIMPTIEAVDDTGVPIAGGARVWWDGQIVFDGPVDGGGNVFQGGYIEFGSGCYWQVNAGTEVDFDWVGFGDVNDFPVPPGITGDYNDDGKVDAADYVVWRKNEGTMNLLPNDPIGSTIGQGQYDNWRANFGAMAMPGGASAVPEPTTIGLLFLALLVVLARPRFL